MQTLTDHQTPVDSEQGRNGMHLENATSPSSPRHILHNPPIMYPPSHQASQPQRRRNRGSFKVFRLSGRVFGKHGDGDVEAGQTREATEDEESKQDVVEGSAETEREGGGGGGDAEGDLVLFASTKSSSVEI